MCVLMCLLICPGFYVLFTVFVVNICELETLKYMVEGPICNGIQAKLEGPKLCNDIQAELEGPF